MQKGGKHGASGAVIAFQDETVFQLQPVRRRTWAPSGRTPIQKVSERRTRLSTIGVLVASPELRHFSFYFQLLQENISTEPLIWFLTQMHRHLRHHVIIVWDGVPVHRSAAAWFEENHPTWFTFERLPAYAPELNPIEECWNHTKYDDLANYIPQDLADLESNAKESMANQSDKQQLLRSCFHYAELDLGDQHSKRRAQ